jgi:hypothetical protein
LFSETDELIGAEENIDGQIKQHFIIKESGYSWVLSYNDASALYCMSAWDMQDDKVSFFVELDTDNYYNNSGLGGLAALKVWLFDYVQGSLPRFEWFTCDVYQQEAVQRYHSMGVKKYGGAICRHIYEYECKTENGLSRYKIYKCWGSSNDMIPDGTQDICL